MEQMALDGQQEYAGLKEELRKKLDETSENFIIIGFILKQVRDKCLYLNDGYKDIYEFGMGSYGLSKATVSRFMNMNTKFSTGGNSREIKQDYKGYGRSKIQEMLNVDENDMSLITENTTVEQVKELKAAEKEQRQLEREEKDRNLPLVQMAGVASGKKKDGNGTDMTPFGMLMTAFWKENNELYAKAAAGIITPKIMAEEISPSGSRTYRSGVNIMFFYDFDKGAKLRSYDKGRAVITPYTYAELMEKSLNLNITPAREGTQEKEAGPEEKTETPYIPLPGQISINELPDLTPDEAEEISEVIDGEYRDLDEQHGGELDGGGGIRGGYEPALVDDLIKEYASYLETALSEKKTHQVCRYNCLLDALDLLREECRKGAYTIDEERIGPVDRFAQGNKRTRGKYKAH